MKVILSRKGFGSSQTPPVMGASVILSTMYELTLLKQQEKASGSRCSQAPQAPNMMPLNAGQIQLVEVIHSLFTVGTVVFEQMKRVQGALGDGHHRLPTYRSYTDMRV